MKERWAAVDIEADFGLYWVERRQVLDELAAEIRSYFAGMRVVEEERAAAQRDIAMFLMGEGAAVLATRLAGLLGRWLARRVGLERVVAPRAVPLLHRRTPEDWLPDEAATRLDELATQGHAPSRHEGQVRLEEHMKRIHDGIDPATGTAMDVVTGRAHGRVPTSTSFTSEEALAQAEHAARQSPEFLRQAGSGKKFIVVEDLRLKDALGADYLSHVEGYTSQGVTGLAVRHADLEGGGIRAIYKGILDARGEKVVGYKLWTMYPTER